MGLRNEEVRNGQASAPCMCDIVCVCVCVYSRKREEAADEFVHRKKACDRLREFPSPPAGYLPLDLVLKMQSTNISFFKESSRKGFTKES